MKAANAPGTPAAITVAARALDAALDGAPLDVVAIRQELRREQLVKRRLVETELRREVLLQQMIPVSRAIAFHAALADAVQRCVRSQDERAAIRREFLRLTADTTIDADFEETGGDQLE